MDAGKRRGRAAGVAIESGTFTGVRGRRERKIQGVTKEKHRSCNLNLRVLTAPKARQIGIDSELNWIETRRQHESMKKRKKKIHH